MLVFLLTALLTALVAACSTASSGTRATPTTVSGARLTASGVNIAKLSTITVTAHDYSFAMPTTIPAGLTVVKLVNFGFVMPANLNVWCELDQRASKQRQFCQNILPGSISTR
jgi:hypothetical protein